MTQGKATEKMAFTLTAADMDDERISRLATFISRRLRAPGPPPPPDEDDDEEGTDQPVDDNRAALNAMERDFANALRSIRVAQRAWSLQTTSKDTGVRASKLYKKHTQAVYYCAQTVRDLLGNGEIIGAWIRKSKLAAAPEIDPVFYDLTAPGYLRGQIMEFLTLPSATIDCNLGLYYTSGRPGIIASADTEPVVLARHRIRHHLGPFKVSICFDPIFRAQTPRLRVHPTDIVRLVGKDMARAIAEGNSPIGYWHPHVHVNGEVCFGESVGPFTNAARRGGLMDCFRAIAIMLSDYHRTEQYYRFDCWSNSPCECPQCGELTVHDKDKLISIPMQSGPIKVHEDCVARSRDGYFRLKKDLVEYEGHWYAKADMVKCDGEKDLIPAALTASIVDPFVGKTIVIRRTDAAACSISGQQGRFIGPIGSKPAAKYPTDIVELPGGKRICDAFLDLYLAIQPQKEITYDVVRQWDTAVGVPVPRAGSISRLITAKSA